MLNLTSAIFTLLAVLASSSSALAISYVTCAKDTDRLKLRQQELQDIVAEDQADRKNTPINWDVVAPRDEYRRKRVGEIFGEGCFVTAKDFAAAALVFQHGEVSDHYLQAFLWAKRAVELGDAKQRHLMAAGIDRYLVKLGHKQLYATQAWRKTREGCNCLQQVETTFPDKRRMDDADWSLNKGLEMVSRFNEGKNCGTPKICSDNLKPTPQGFVPGLW